MIKSIMRGKKGDRRKLKAAELLQLELSEIEELSALLMSRIDERLKRLKEVESRIDEKLTALETMINRAEAIEKEHPDYLENRYREVVTLASKGLKIKEIAHILDLPEGEVELILGMKGQ